MSDEPYTLYMAMQRASAAAKILRSHLRDHPRIRLFQMERATTEEFALLFEKLAEAMEHASGEPLWWKVLGVERTASKDAIKRAFRSRAAALHPDKPGGSHAAMTALAAARDAGLAARAA